MPIKVQCSCGAAFAAKDELAGKTVKCPKCKEPLRIGAASPAKGAPAKAVPKATVAKPAAKPAVAKPVRVKPIAEESAAVLPVTSTESLYDEIGLQAAAVGTRPCPGCTEPMPLEAIICIKCGYNARIGRRMETAKMSGSEGDVGHGSVASSLLEKAAQTIDDDAEADKKKTSEGMPWWVYLIFLAALVGFLGTMLYLGNRAEWLKEEQKKKEQQQGQGQIQRENGFYVASVGSPAMPPRMGRPLAEATV